MPVLLVLCFVSTLCAPLIFSLLLPVWYGFFNAFNIDPPTHIDFARVRAALTHAALFSGGLCVAGLGFLLLRRRVIAARGQEPGITWDCGYRLPSARMQYTGGSFASTIALTMRGLLRPKLDDAQNAQSDSRPGIRPDMLPNMRSDDTRPLFPQRLSAVFQTPDWALGLWADLLFKPAARLADAAKGLQHGLLNGYILYILTALILALTWALGWS